MLLETAKSFLIEAGIKAVEREGTLVLMVEEGGKEVVIYVMAEEDRGLIYILASASPPIILKSGFSEVLRASWEIADRGIPCKVCMSNDTLAVEHDLDACHFTKNSLLEGIYLAAESMFYLMERLGSEGAGHQDGLEGDP